METLLFDKNSSHCLLKLLPANAMEIRAKTTDSKRKRDKVEVDNEKVGTAPIGKCSLQVLKPFHVQPGHLILNGDCNHDNHDFVIIDVGKTRFKVRFALS